MANEFIVTEWSYQENKEPVGLVELNLNNLDNSKVEFAKIKPVNRERTILYRPDKDTSWYTFDHTETPTTISQKQDAEKRLGLQSVS